MEKAKAELLIRKVPIKQDGLDLAKEKESFVKACQEIDSTKVPVHTTEKEEVGVFLQACMKLLCNQQDVAILQALIDNCTSRTNSVVRLKDVHKLYKRVKRTGWEM